MLNPSDVLGTPFSLVLDEATDDTVLLHPPTIRFFESLFATYNISLSEAINPPEDLEQETTYIKVLSRTMQMLHIAAHMVDPEITFNDVEQWTRDDPNILTRYLQSFAQHLPADNRKTKSAIKPKKRLTPKVWIPR